MPILSLLVALVLFCLIVWAALKLTAAFAIPDPLRTVILVVVVVLGVLIVLSYLGGPGPVMRWR
jgi:hypothetical protein